MPRLGEVVTRLGTCGCRYPLLLDRQAGFWRHLSDGSPCLPRGIVAPLSRLRSVPPQRTTLAAVAGSSGAAPDEATAIVMPPPATVPRRRHRDPEETIVKHQIGQRVRVIAESIQRSNGAVWKGAVGAVVNVTGDGYQLSFDGTVLDNVKDHDVMAV